MPAAEQAASVWIVPALKRKIATIAASDRMNAHGLTLAKIGMSKPRSCQRSGAVSRKIVCNANQIARLRMTPTTAAVMPASAPDNGLLSRKRSIKGAPSPIHNPHGTKDVQVARRPPQGTASSGGKETGSQQGARKPTKRTAQSQGARLRSGPPG